MVKACPRCKEGQLLKAPGDTTASCLQCGYEEVDIVSKPLPTSRTKWYCQECNKYLRGQKWFDKHMKKFHSDAPQSGVPTLKNHSSLPPPFSERKEIIPNITETFICPICKKKFYKKVQLDGHMATHSDRPTDSMGVLEQAEKVLRKNIIASEDGQKVKLKEARQHVLSAIEVLL